jgi:hypothetical protein
MELIKPKNHNISIKIALCLLQPPIGIYKKEVGCRPYPARYRQTPVHTRTNNPPYTGELFDVSCMYLNWRF